jgi:chemotaxis protein MotB
MPDYNGSNPVIIKKKKASHGGHGGAWKVAYADFVTAMMALFIVLWVLGQDSSVREAVARYFKNPIGFSNGGKSVLKGGPPNIVNLSDPGSTKKDDEREQLKKMGDKIMSELSANPDFSNLLDHLKVEIVEEGLRIELLDSEQDIFFEIGTAELKPAARKLLAKIAAQLEKLPNKIVIEGHTDSRPYSGSMTGYSNFELSVDRSNSARRMLVSSGLNDNSIEEIRGYADRRLRDENNPYDVSNRRISIIVKFMGK